MCIDRGWSFELIIKVFSYFDYRKEFDMRRQERAPFGIMKKIPNRLRVFGRINRGQIVSGLDIKNTSGPEIVLLLIANAMYEGMEEQCVHLRREFHNYCREGASGLYLNGPISNAN